MKIGLKILMLVMLSLMICACTDDGGGLSESGGSTLSGSYANMLTVGEFLYVVSDDNLITYSITIPDQPTELDRQELVFGIESLFHRAGILFVGSMTSMYIYQINELGIPELKSETPYTNFENITPCDPIVANDTLAIASLSSVAVPTGGCGAALIDEIRFFDITDIEQPVQFNSVEMEQPKGLGLDDNILFVCEAQNGLKIFDIQNALDVKLLYHFEGFKTFDIIATGSLALVVGPDNLYEFDYSDIDDVKLLSNIEL